MSSDTSKPTPGSGPEPKSATNPPATAETFVLLVDDNPVIRQIFRRALEQQQFKVVEAESAARALKLLESRQPGLIVLDLMMLGMDGFQFLTQMRRRPEWQGIPVVVLSAKPLSDQERAFVATNAQHFLRKSEAACAEVATLAVGFLRPPGV